MTAVAVTERLAGGLVTDLGEDVTLGRKERKVMHVFLWGGMPCLCGGNGNGKYSAVMVPLPGPNSVFSLWYLWPSLYTYL